MDLPTGTMVTTTTTINTNTVMVINMLPLLAHHQWYRNPVHTPLVAAQHPHRQNPL